MGRTLRILFGIGVFGVVVLLLGAYFGGAFASTGGTLRPGKWTNDIELARFESDFTDGTLDASLRESLTSPWGLGEETSKSETVCLDAADAAALGKLGKTPDPPGWSSGECKFTRRKNRSTVLDTAVSCRSDDRKHEQRLSLTGTLAPAEAQFKLVVDDRFIIGEEVQTAHWEIVTKSVRVGECEGA